MRITFSKTLLLATTAFSMISVPAANAYLSPLSFNEMYAHASRGNLTVLNNAILRGMNINAVNGDGDTGICVAIRRGDHIAYESFRNTGAHTRPRCLNNINAKQYKKFMADHRPYELAYRKEGSSIWWWIGGAAAVGGIALAAGGGGGGGGSDPLPVPAPEDPTFHSNKGLGYVVATSDPSEPETTPYEPVMISAEDKTTEVNRESMQLSNNAKMWVYNPDTFGYDTLLLSDLIDFDKDINSYTKYIRVGMRAYNDSVVINDTEQTISAGSGTVGLDALLNSSASNLGTIEISAPNGSIGMVASDYSEAGNTGTISMEFTGKDTADSLIGMYADTNSSLTNAGTISGKADTARGRVTGMQTRLTSYYADFVNKAVNSGKIELSGSSDNAGGMSLWGMSSWLDRAFIDGDKSAAKLDKATLTNKGDISLTFSLQPSDEEGAVDPEDPLTLAAGNGGIVGMHADANTTATNNGNITIAVTGDAGETLSAGMQAVRGGSIVNGDGGKGINTTANSSFTNKGTINVNGKNGYGIYAEGTSKVTNSGDIYLNATTATKTSSALYAGGSAVIENSGNLHITASGNGYIWAAYAEGSGSIKNSGTIYVDKATDLIFSGNVTNNGTIEAAAGRMLLNEQVKFGSNARFVADEIAGTASVSADTVKQSNRTQFVLSGNFEGNTDRLNVRSESYLFDADFDGEKTTLNMKKFAEVENNASIAGFLQNNYGRNNNSDLFDELKSASSQKELTKRISQISGRDVIPTMAEQNLALMKDLHRQFDNAWFNAAPDDKLIAGFNYYDRERGGYGNFAGSDDNAVSLFGIFRNNEGKNVSYGLGWSISKFDSKYDNGGKKDEVIAEILLPFGFGNENFRFLGNMYGGYGNGEYKRYAEGGRFTGDVENYYYGVNNELRGSFDAGFGISLQPTAEFNVAGLYQSGIDDGGLKTGHNNNLSVESGFGLYAEKEFLFNDENSLRLRFGSTWYHEFNDKYQTVKARLDGMEGRFAMDRAEYEKDRGLFSLNGEYRNGGFSFYGETAFEAGRSDNWIFNTGFKYAF